MKGTKLVGAVLLFLGILSLAYGGFTYTKSTDTTNLGPVHIEVADKEIAGTVRHFMAVRFYAVWPPSDDPADPEHPIGDLRLPRRHEPAQASERERSSADDDPSGYAHGSSGNNRLVTRSAPA